MNARTGIVSLGLLAVALSTALFARGDGPSTPAPKLDLIKKLAGDWVAQGEDGKPGTEIQNSYRVTAAGSAVIETIMPGSDHEMITMYHMDGDDLVLTHYCVMGNQPRYRAKWDGQDLVFECDGGTYRSSHDEGHMHRGIVTFVDDDHMNNRWEMVKDGEVTYVAAGNLVRKVAE